MGKGWAWGGESGGSVLLCCLACDGEVFLCVEVAEAGDRAHRTAPEPDLGDAHGAEEGHEELQVGRLARPQRDVLPAADAAPAAATHTR